jgi:hypothetical protein
MRNIAVVHGMRQVNGLSGLIVLRWLHLHSEDNTDFHILPALFANVDTGTIH